MMATFFEELSSRGAGVLFGLVLGSLVTWLFALRRRYRQHQSILKGDARDTVVIAHHLVTTAEGPGGTLVPAILRIRSLGQGELHRVIPNEHLAAELLRRASRVTAHDTFISMEGAEGSYLLETLTDFVCDRIANAPFEHDLYVMAPCCEPACFARYQPITILLISVKDLALFETWQACRDVQVEHGSDGARLLTLMELARRFRSEQEKIASLRQAGRPTTHVETTYLLDLALDRRSAAGPVREVPWDRFANVLKQLGLG